MMEKLQVMLAGAAVDFEFITLYDGTLEYEVQFDSGGFNGIIVECYEERADYLEKDDPRYNQLLATALCVQNREAMK